MKNFFAYLYIQIREFFNGFNKQKTLPIPIETIPSVPETPEPNIDPSVLTIGKIQHTQIKTFEEYLGIHETGKNTDHGGEVDKTILSEGGELGHAWCGYMFSRVTWETCKKLGIKKYPKGLYRGGSSQKFWHKSDQKYIRPLPQPGYAAIGTNPKDKSTGHICMAISALKANNSFDSIGGNESDKVKYNNYQLKQASAFVDVPQAILDQWKLENP